MAFVVNLDPRAIRDVQKAIDYYDYQQEGLGEQFDIELDEYLFLLEINPYFQIRYETVHCLPLKRFPYMIHFLINENQHIVTVLAVLYTGGSTEKWVK